MTIEHARRLADGLLTIGLAGLTFLLGCQELFDSDVWWHLRAGRWILEHRAVPRVDPFTFASAGRPWVDVHWLFQVALVLAHGAGGVAGTILLAASVVTVAVLAGFLLRSRDWPAWVVVAGWVPGLLLASTRFDPRPEIVTLVGLSVFLGVLLRARRRPAWLWLLVPLEVLWVNAHGLFVLGPWMVALFLLDRAVLPEGQPPWRRLLPPSLAVVAACLANPYGVRGVLFPLELFPKLTEAGGSYKQYIGEFMSPRMLVASYWSVVPGRDLYLQLFVFLLVAQPVTILVASAWRAWSSARPAEAETGRDRAWAGVMVLALGLALAVALGLPGPATPALRVAIGRGVPWVLAGTGLAGAVVLARRSRLAAVVAAAGSGAVAFWAVWLVNELEHPEPVPVAPGLLALGLGVPAALLSIRAGTRPFGGWVAATFAFLSLLSVRNMSLFGLVGGGVLAAELGAWAAELVRGSRGGRDDLPGAPGGVLAPRLVGLGVLAVLGAAVVSDRFFARTEECHHFGLRERPFYYAHAACRFAGRPGLPARALVFGLNQAAVYVEENAPGRQVFIDGRLEVASRDAFELYARIHRWMTVGDPRWGDAVRRTMGGPLILVDHEENTMAEASLLADPAWRCVYLDPVAAVFLPRGPESSSRALEGVYPTLDFAGGHFHRGAPGPSIPAIPGSAEAEARALVRLGSVLAHRPVPAWSLRIPLELLAMDRARQAIAESAGSAGPWTTLGHAAVGLVVDPGPVPDGPAAPWDPALGLAWAQASSAYREAMRRDPGDPAASGALAATFGMRGMDDARRMLASAGGSGSAAADLAPPWPGEERLAGAVDDLLRRGRPAGAVALAAEARRRGVVLSWPIADRVGCACLHLGAPADARRVWLEAASSPASAEALRAARLADADLAAWNLPAAEAGYRRALKLDPDRADARVGLAFVALEQGRAGEALAAARAALATASEPRVRSLLEGIVTLSEAYAR